MAMHSNREPAPRAPLVDHSPDDRLLMSLYLRRSGVEILTASNGEEALQIAAAKLPELVVLDLMMQGMSGFEVCKRIKSILQPRDTGGLPYRDRQSRRPHQGIAGRRR